MLSKRLASVAAAVALAAGALVVPAGAALADIGTDRPPTDVSIEKPVYNKAGVKELMRATSLLKSATRSVKTVISLSERITALEEAEKPNYRLIERLDRRRETAEGKAAASFNSASRYVEAAFDAHSAQAEFIENSGRIPADSRSWVRAMLALQTAEDMLNALLNSSGETLNSETGEAIDYVG